MVRVSQLGGYYVHITYCALAMYGNVVFGNLGIKSVTFHWFTFLIYFIPRGGRYRHNLSRNEIGLSVIRI